MICSFVAILAWKLDDDDDAADDADAAADDDYDDDYKSDPYMSPSYAGDTKNYTCNILQKHMWILISIFRMVMTNHKFVLAKMDIYKRNLE